MSIAASFGSKSVLAALLLVVMYPVLAASQPVAIKFKAVVGDSGFVCGNSYDGIGITKSRITNRASLLPTFVSMLARSS